MDGEKNVIFNTIGSPIEQRGSDGGNPNAILHCGSPLNRRQRVLLAMLPEYDSRAVVRKDRVSMKDLSALTAATGDEFALFTRGPKRLVIRGDTEPKSNKKNNNMEGTKPINLMIMEGTPPLRGVPYPTF